MKPLLRLATLLAVAGLNACNAAPTPTLTPTPTPTPTATATATANANATATTAPQFAFKGFSVGYETGSVPPPFNYKYELDGTFAGDALNVSYVLTYQFRDVLTPAEITSEGYTAHDDISWTGHLAGQALDTWRTLLTHTHLGPIPPLAPGAGSFTVTLVPLVGDDQVGVPENRDEWQTAITALDKQARAETGATRTEP